MTYTNKHDNTVVTALQFHDGANCMTDIWNMLEECVMTYKYDESICSGVLGIKRGIKCGIKCVPDDVVLMNSDWVVLENSGFTDLKDDKIVMYNDVDFNDKYKETE